MAASGVIYFRKIYIRHSFCTPEKDPRLMYVACLYLASKAEESLLQAKHIVTYVKMNKPSWPYDVKHILDAEMVRTWKFSELHVVKCHCL